MIEMHMSNRITTSHGTICLYLRTYFLSQGNDNSVDSQVSFVVICIKLQSIKPSNHQIQLGQNFLMS